MNGGWERENKQERTKKIKMKRKREHNNNKSLNYYPNVIIETQSFIYFFCLSYDTFKLERRNRKEKYRKIIKYKKNRKKTHTE